jgi:hypothetical protein
VGFGTGGGGGSTHLVTGDGGRPAAAGEVTWTDTGVPGMAAPWAAPGCDGVPADRDGTSVASLTVAPSDKAGCCKS